MTKGDPLTLAWRNRKIPLINGVTFRDGTCIRLELYYANKNWSAKTAIKILDEDGGVDMWTIGVFGWTFFGEMFALSVQGKDIEIVGGEGGMGADGFIAALDIRDNAPLWVLFFDDSNPFDFAEVRGSTIRAHSTLDCIWEINLDDPTEISITRMAS